MASNDCKNVREWETSQVRVITHTHTHTFPQLKSFSSIFCNKIAMIMMKPPYSVNIFSLMEKWPEQLV